MPFQVSFSFWKAALLIGLLAFSAVLWLNSHVGYEAKSALLIKAHGDQSSEDLAETIAAFAETNTFVERTLSSTRLQESMMGGKTPEQQHALVSQTFVYGGGKKGGLILIKSRDLDAEVATVVSQESTETLVRMARLYLGDEKEFSIALIDQSIVSKKVVDRGAYITKTVATTLVLFVIILLVAPTAAWIQRLFAKKNRVTDAKELEEKTPDQRFVPQKLDPAFLYPEYPEPSEAVVPVDQPKASEVLKDEVYGGYEEPISPSKTPLQSVSVAMEDLPFTFETPVEEVQPDQVEQTSRETNMSEHAALSVAEALPTEKEPSVVEYKRRLNELLAQK